MRKRGKDDAHAQTPISMPINMPISMPVATMPIATIAPTPANKAARGSDDGGFADASSVNDELFEHLMAFGTEAED